MLVSQCKSNVRLIGQALLDYESTNGCFPSAFTVDDAGRPLHSWRTLILPFLGESERYQSIDLTLPWDHPKNAKALIPTPAVFRCPIRAGAERRDDGTTDYVGIVGEETQGKANGIGTKLAEVNDANQSKLMIIEMGKDRIAWMSTDDITYGQFVKGLSTMAQAGGILDSHNQYCNCAYCDGNDDELTLQSDKQELVSSLSIHGD